MVNRPAASINNRQQICGSISSRLADITCDRLSQQRTAELLTQVGLSPADGEIPNPIDPPSGCAFHPRCPLAAAHCRKVRPELTTLDSGVQVACHAVIQGEKWQPDAGLA